MPTIDNYHYYWIVCCNTNTYFDKGTRTVHLLVTMLIVWVCTLARTRVWLHEYWNVRACVCLYLYLPTRIYVIPAFIRVSAYLLFQSNLYSLHCLSSLISRFSQSTFPLEISLPSQINLFIASYILMLCTLHVHLLYLDAVAIDGYLAYT